MVHLFHESLCLVFVLVLSSTVQIVQAGSTIVYQLSYDGLVRIQDHQDGDDSNSISTHAEKITRNLAHDIISHRREDYGKEDVVMDEQPIFFHSRYFLDIHFEGVSLSMDTNILAAMDNNNKSSDHDALRLDIIISAEGENSQSLGSRSIQEVLIKVVQSITVNDDHQSSSSASSLWTIKQRLSPFQTTQLRGSSDPSSLESIILANSGIMAKTRVYPKHGLSMASTPNVEVWSYTYSTAGTENHASSLFMDSKLRATTLIAGIAHAEAFVHPALLAHSNPTRVVIISDSPVPLLKEIFKHKSVESVKLVGANLETIEATKSCLPQLNDCSLNGNGNQSCVDDERVQIIDSGVSVEEWMEQEHEDIDEEAGVADVFLIDVASFAQSQHFLSRKFHQEGLQYLLNDEALVVVNAGNAPCDPSHQHQVHDKNDEMRSEFFGMVSRVDSGYGFVMLYDEPLAAPLDSTFLVITTGDFSESYTRFVRPTPTAIDLDIVKRFHPQSSPLPTQFYDGSTHKNYLTPSRCWENWYCESPNLGKDGYECKELLQKFYDPAQHIARTTVKRDKVKGRKLVAANDFPEGTFINADDSHLHLHIHGYQWQALNKFVEEYPDAKMYQELVSFFLSYGFENEVNGQSGWSVSIACMNTFTNHACEEADRSATSTYPDTGGDELLFSPLQLRRKEFGMLTVANRNIKIGDEIMMDYSLFRTHDKDGEYKIFLQNMCQTGEGHVPIEVDDEADGSEL